MTYFIILLFAVGLFYSALAIKLVAKDEWSIEKGFMFGIGVTGIAITSISIFFLTRSL